ncbi:zinc finger and BTB domain-containing protein 8A isoform X3 [Cherax quadricarinatus]|uniref:zinc finger and BTB domain-containing protein 8A isoform X3 n=1 Tax=Cherax quadricarinatus TaxID=27406 RepID=UPI00387E8E0E
MKTARPRSPSHAAKNKTPQDRVWEFGCVLGERNGRLLCRPCNLALDHTRRSTIVEHLRSRKHQRYLDEMGLQESPPLATTSTHASVLHTDSTPITPVIYVDVGEETTAQDASGHAPSPTPSNQGLVGPYLLKKETHCSTVLDQLLRDDTYTDVTLTAEGQSLRAHRIVLCLASPYFRQVLSRELNVQSVVLLRDIKFAELRNIINFIYTGEATVDASELESFMRTAEMLEISSLCEGQKCISGRGLHTQGNFSSGFSIADFERLLGSKRSRKDSSPTPCKTRRVSGEGQSSRCSSAEPAATSIPLSLIKEEPGCETDSMLQSKSAQVVKENELLDVVERNEGGGESGGSRRESLESVGGFAAIAGVQKTLPNADDVSEDVFSSTAELSPNSQLAEAARQNAVTSVPDTMSIPGRCPYCPHLPQKYEGVAMMRHLLVAHPCKPAFPCDSCWRVFVKRVYFKAHQQKCSPPIS